MDYYQKTAEQVFQELKSNRDGLSEEEVKKRLAEYGPNIFQRRKIRSISGIFFSQFANFLILLLVLAFFISLFTEQFSHSAVLLLVILLNVLMGFILEYKAERALESLKKIFTHKATVIREGKKKIISAHNIVPGDIIYLAQGDRVPADVRLFELTNLEIDESALTGESVPSSKMTKPSVEKKEVIDQENIAFCGTIVTAGSGKGIAITTAGKTEIGKIAQEIQEEPETTPLQLRLNYLGKVLALFSVVLVLIIFVLGFLRGADPLSLFNYSVALFVSAVPESLPTIVTLTLAIGVIKMAKAKAIVRKLPAVETLASVNVICADKTGTLTKNEMTVKKIWTLGKGGVNIKGEGYLPEPKFAPQTSDLKQLIKAGFLCNNAALSFNKEKEKWEVIGDPTEGALLVLGEKAGAKEEFEDHDRIHEILFEAERRRMSVLVEEKEGVYIYTKGAPEAVLSISSFVLKNGQKIALTKELRKEIETEYRKMAFLGFRVLGLGFREAQKDKTYDSEKIEKDLIFLGLVGLIDPPTEGVKEAIKKCLAAKIRPMVITGDHKLTALAVARELGFRVEEGNILLGADLEKMDDKEIEEIIDKIVIFARTQPLQKIKIVNLLKKKGYLVAMTGDGVNDAPALKQADIGIAMGERGQDVAREASDLILTDDKFPTIEKAVELGRTIYENIEKFIKLLLAANFEELILVAIAFLIGWPQPFTALQILWINLITDSFPALALAFEKPSQDIMKEPPKDPQKSILKPIIFYAFWVSLLALVLEVFLFLKYLAVDLALARTMVFTFIVVFELFLVFSIRSKRPFWKGGVFSNKFLILAVLISIFLQLLALYTPLAGPMGSVALNLSQWGVIVGFSLGCFLILELAKVLRSRK